MAAKAIIDIIFKEPVDFLNIKEKLELNGYVQKGINNVGSFNK